MKRFFVVFVMMMVFFLSMEAQLGYSSGSYSVVKRDIEQYRYPRSSDIRVEEYMNYYRHNFELPKKDQSVGLSVEITDDYNGMNRGTTSRIVQIGICTPEHRSLRELPALNVSLVIDRSGSMAGDRINKAKQAAILFIRQLRPIDRISVVLFDHIVEVLIPSQRVEDIPELIERVNAVFSRGSTDLNTGLMTGYRQVASFYNPKATNKVFILTDALTNTGQVNPWEIIKNMDCFNQDHEIQLSMIAIGSDFNQNLSRQLADHGKTSFHFINDGEDIQKVFIDEVQSMMMTVAENCFLDIEIDPSCSVSDFYGYHPEQLNNHRIRLRLENMNAGLTQVFIFRIVSNEPFPLSRRLIKASLRYDDIQQGEPVTLTAYQLDARCLPERAAEIKKNFTIAYLADAIFQMSALAEKQLYAQAHEIVSRSLDYVRSTYPYIEDSDISRVYNQLLAFERMGAMHETCQR